MQLEVIRIPDHKIWDWYDLNFGDDIQEATTALTSAVPQNWTLPYPADAEDPDEAILVKSIYQYPAFKLIQDLGTAVTDSLTSLGTITSMFGFFEFDETDESTEAYRDEVKEALGHITVYQSPASNKVIGTDGGANEKLEFELEKKLEFTRPMVFPLNPAMKTEYQHAGSTTKFIDLPTDWYYRMQYRVVRNPLDFLGRILGLMRQNLSV